MCLASVGLEVERGDGPTRSSAETDLETRRWPEPVNERGTSHVREGRGTDAEYELMERIRRRSVGDYELILRIFRQSLTVDIADCEGVARARAGAEFEPVASMEQRGRDSRAAKDVRAELEVESRARRGGGRQWAGSTVRTRLRRIRGYAVILAVCLNCRSVADCVKVGCRSKASDLEYISLVTGHHQHNLGNSEQGHEDGILYGAGRARVWEYFSAEEKTENPVSDSPSRKTAAQETGYTTRAGLQVESSFRSPAEVRKNRHGGSTAHAAPPPRECDAIGMTSFLKPNSRIDEARRQAPPAPNSHAVFHSTPNAGLHDASHPPRKSTPSIPLPAATHRAIEASERGAARLKAQA
ncbi:hypothetical protein DFH09DRAFT_1084475 [Mycena vulgaris]|nr:hypothetical protein DFH09DRAFT_1084475 [Mycena vulgaris]